MTELLGELPLPFALAVSRNSSYAKCESSFSGTAEAISAMPHLRVITLQASLWVMGGNDIIQLNSQREQVEEAWGCTTASVYPLKVTKLCDTVP